MTTPEWLQRHLPDGWTGQDLVWFGAAVFVVSLVGSLALVAWVLVRLPADYFACEKPTVLWVDHHPVIRFLLHVVKNLIGLALIGIGVILSLPGVPGQGVLTILIGAMALDFPGKRRAERWLVSRRGVRTGIDAIRRRFGKPPLVAPGSPEAVCETTPVGAGPRS